MIKVCNRCEYLWDDETEFYCPECGSCGVCDCCPCNRKNCDVCAEEAYIGELYCSCGRIECPICFEKTAHLDKRKLKIQREWWDE